MVSYRSDVKALAAKAAALEHELAELSSGIEVEERRVREARRAIDAARSGSSGCSCVLALVLAPWLGPLIYFGITAVEARSSLDETTTWRVRSSTHAAVSTGNTCEAALVRRTLSSECRATLTCGETVLPIAVGTCALNYRALVYWSDADRGAEAVLSSRAERGMWKSEAGVILLEKPDH